ncbi:MAG: tetratricopeptide repeat protein, partial [Bacteroidetes bacterium]|nr:tetratricopeptide repeat protein [Bacteroidota bacterium]
EAIADLSDAINILPAAIPYFYRGLAYYSKGSYLASIDDYTEAIKLDPTINQAYYNRSGAHLALKDTSRALQDAIKAAELGFKVDEQYFVLLNGSSSTE